MTSGETHADKTADESLADQYLDHLDVSGLAEPVLFRVEPEQEREFLPGYEITTNVFAAHGLSDDEWVLSLSASTKSVCDVAFDATAVENPVTVLEDVQKLLERYHTPPPHAPSLGLKLRYAMNPVNLSCINGVQFDPTPVEDATGLSSEAVLGPFLLRALDELACAGAQEPWSNLSLEDSPPDADAEEAYKTALDRLQTIPIVDDSPVDQLGVEPTVKPPEKPKGKETEGEIGNKSSNHVGPVSLSHPTAREHFILNGAVVSFRTERTTGETWWNLGRGTVKRGDVRIEEVTKADPQGSALELQPFVDDSGFESVEEWKAAIEEMHGSLSSGRLYRIIAEQGWCDKCSCYNHLTWDRLCRGCVNPETVAEVAKQ